MKGIKKISLLLAFILFSLFVFSCAPSVNVGQSSALDGVGEKSDNSAEGDSSNLDNNEDKKMTAKEFTAICQNAQDNATIKLERPQIFDVYSDDTLVVEGYHFSNTALKSENPNGVRPTFIYMKDKKNVVVDGNGSSVVIHGIMTPFIFDNCENVTLKNFTFDYKNPTMSEFTIEESLGAGEYLIRIAKDTLFDIRDNVIFWRGEVNKSGKYYWEYNYRDPMMIAEKKDPVTEYTQMFHYEDGRFPCIPEFERITVVDGRLLRVKLKDENATFPVGSTVQTRYTAREQIGGAFVNCKDVVCKNLRIKAMHGLGLLAQVCENVTFDGLNITPGEGRTIASNADFFQVSNCSGLVKIENCVCSDGHDDFVNAHGTHLKIIEVDKNKALVRFMEAHTWGIKMFFKGDAVDFINSKTLLPYGSAKLKSAELISDTDYLLEFEEAVNAEVGDVVENATRTPELIIRNNVFGPSTGRGILCTTRKKVLIENNKFYKNAGNVLCIEDDCNFWYESSYTTDVRFINNEVIECGYGSVGVGVVPVILINPQVLYKDAPVFVHKRIEISNNKFTMLSFGDCIIDVKYTDTFIFKDNECTRSPDIRLTSVKELITS